MHPKTYVKEVKNEFGNSVTDNGTSHYFYGTFVLWKPFSKQIP